MTGGGGSLAFSHPCQTVLTHKPARKGRAEASAWQVASSSLGAVSTIPKPLPVRVLPSSAASPTGHVAQQNDTSTASTKRGYILHSIKGVPTDHLKFSATFQRVPGHSTLTAQRHAAPYADFRPLRRHPSPSPPSPTNPQLQRPLRQRLRRHRSTTLYAAGHNLKYGGTTPTDCQRSPPTASSPPPLSTGIHLKITHSQSNFAYYLVN